MRDRIHGAILFKEPAPLELITARLCMELKCLPSHLDGESWEDIQCILAVMRSDADKSEREINKSTKR